MSTDLKDTFLPLVRLGIGGETGPDMWLKDQWAPVDWKALVSLASAQGLLGVALDGIEKLPEESQPTEEEIVQAIGKLLKAEKRYAEQWRAATKLAEWFHLHGIRTYVLKGRVVAECYPRPQRRRSVDLDCFLLPENGSVDAWESGNLLVEEKGYEVRRDFYKNSTFMLPELTVENHRFFTPFRGNQRLLALERWLQDQMKKNAGKEDRFEASWLYRPPVMVSALFLIEHAYSHFLHEGLTWKHVLDWVMFSRKHGEEIDWQTFLSKIDAYGFRQFYDSFTRLGFYMLNDPVALTYEDRLMMEDIWAPLDIHESVVGVRGKLALVGNTWHARWKYRHFTDISWRRALWIQVKGYLFEKEPKL